MGCKKIMTPSYICQHGAAYGEIWDKGCENFIPRIIVGNNGKSIITCSHMFPPSGQCMCVKEHKKANKVYSETSQQLKLFQGADNVPLP